MKTSIKQFIASLIEIENQKLKAQKWDEIPKKELMSQNRFHSLPISILQPLYSRDSLQRIMNFIEHLPNAISNANSTNLQRMEYLLYNFTDDYMKWATENEKDFPIIQMVEGFPNLSESTKAELRAMSKHEIFTFLTTHMIHQYADDNQAPEPEDNEPEAA